MLMSRKQKSINKYILMSCLLMVLVAPVLYIAGKPVLSYVRSHGKMIIIKGAPGYLDEYGQATIINTDMIKDIPALNTRYGAIYSDRIGLAVPLYYGDDYKTLEKGVCQYPKSGLPGHGRPILISGHSSTFFAPLEQLELGDVVYIDTNYGSYSYKVDSIEITDSSDTTAYDLELDEEELIIYTCYPFGKLVGDEDGRIFYHCSPTLLE